MSAKILRPVIFGLLAVGLAACGTTTVFDDTPLDAPSSFIRLSPSAPPAAPPEEKQKPSEPMREAWRPGHWEYDGSQFYWVSGELIALPNPTAVWVADRWELRTFGWAFIPGYWQ